MTTFTSKASTLNNLQGKIKSAKILDQICFSALEWELDKDTICTRLKNKEWFDKCLIIRSSAVCEDSKLSSFAGHFDSVLNVKGESEIKLAIEKVISSLNSEEDEIFIQPMLNNVKIAGVVFTREPSNNAPYFRINYDDKSGTTDTVTSGCSNETKVFYCHRLYKNKFRDFRDQIIELCFDLEEILNHKILDIEFAIDADGQLYLFQVRPLVTANSEEDIDDHAHFQSIVNLATRINSWSQKHPYLYGDKGLYGIMPDWNPAEIIGIKPKPLALSLYREVVTNSIWAYQRDNYGYCCLRSFPLIVEFEGLPYIDVRVSFNSFIPKILDKKIAEKLVNYYLEKLRQNPDLHDKIEFDIAFSCYNFNSKEKINALEKHNFSVSEIHQIKESLIKVTNNIICAKDGLWRKDLEKISKLDKKYLKITNSDIDNFSKIYWLIEDCKRYGTLPFAGLARAAFIAVDILKSLISINVISQQEYNEFISSLNTVSSSLIEDLDGLDKNQFLDKYGHLRPGTYDILSKSYDEDVDGYFNWEKNDKKKLQKDKFRLSVEQLNLIDKLLKENGFSVNALELLNFVKGSIEAREYAKFIFTRNISKVLKIYSDICQDMDIPIEDAAFTHINSVMSLNSIASDPKKVITASIKRRKERFKLTKIINSPPLIRDQDDIFYFHEPIASPNYVTQKRVSGDVVIHDGSKVQDIANKIVLIENADPGYDWIFSRKIAGLITKYGGANSHMAIRSGELNIPAIIGAGNLYDRIKLLNKVTFDCMNKVVKI
jgi:phosphohistidine swiveling domain-containing protein